MKVQNINYRPKYNFSQKTMKQSHSDELTSVQKNSHRAKKTLVLGVISSLTFMTTAFFILKNKRGKGLKAIAKPTSVEKLPPKRPVSSISEVKPKISYPEDMVCADAPVGNRYYDFLMRSPEGFYLESGQDINTFLRTGKLKELPKINESMSEEIKSYVQREIEARKAYNRTIVDSIELLDKKATAVTEEPMTVFRDAPQSWIREAKNGILEDKAFCSTSLTPGASMEGIIGSNAHLNTRYEIRLPKGTKYIDLTYTSEKEILLPRNSKFRVVGDNVLELIL